MNVVEVIPLTPKSGKHNPLNPLSKGTRKHIGDALKAAIANSNVTSIILYGGKNFSAGADIGCVRILTLLLELFDLPRISLNFMRAIVMLDLIPRLCGHALNPAKRHLLTISILPRLTCS